MYYRITVRDNGCGMKHEQIPDFLGRVLAGSKCAPGSRRDSAGIAAARTAFLARVAARVRVCAAEAAARCVASAAAGRARARCGRYGVRQTRGKFGLGAKMALIWSKQSTGMPVEVRRDRAEIVLRAPSRDCAVSSA